MTDGVLTGRNFLHGGFRTGSLHPHFCKRGVFFCQFYRQSVYFTGCFVSTPAEIAQTVGGFLKLPFPCSSFLLLDLHFRFTGSNFPIQIFLGSNGLLHLFLNPRSILLGVPDIIFQNRDFTLHSGGAFFIGCSLIAQFLHLDRTSIDGSIGLLYPSRQRIQFFRNL